VPREKKINSGKENKRSAQRRAQCPGQTNRGNDAQNGGSDRDKDLARRTNPRYAQKSMGRCRGELAAPKENEGFERVS